MKRWLHIFFIGALLTACASVHDAPPGRDTLAVTPSHDNTTPAGEILPESSVDFFDIYTFDRRLSSDLRDDPTTVAVYFQVPASVNDIPDRLGKWLTMVENYGGTVEPREDPNYQTRGLITGGISVAFGAFASLYQVIRDKVLYNPVKAYNATVFYNRSNGMMTRVIFTRKVPNP